MIQTTISQNGMQYSYQSDNGRSAICIKQNGDDKYAVTLNSEYVGVFPQERSKEIVRRHLNATSLKDFFKNYKGVISQKGVALLCGRNINYMSQIATGRRNTKDQVNADVEASLRAIGNSLININII